MLLFIEPTINYTHTRTTNKLTENNLTVQLILDCVIKKPTLVKLNAGASLPRSVVKFFDEEKNIHFIIIL